MARQKRCLCSIPGEERQYMEVNHWVHFNDVRCNIQPDLLITDDVLIFRDYSAIVHLSVITATIPRINSFLADVQTRRAGLALTARDYENYMSSKSGSNGASKGSKGRHSNPLSSPLQSYGCDTQTRITSNGRGNRGDEIELDVRDNIETGSQSSLQRNAVYQKTEFNWTEEYTNPQSSELHRPL